MAVVNRDATGRDLFTGEKIEAPGGLVGRGASQYVRGFPQARLAEQTISPEAPTTTKGEPRMTPPGGEVRGLPIAVLNYLGLPVKEQNLTQAYIRARKLKLLVEEAEQRAADAADLTVDALPLEDKVRARIEVAARELGVSRRELTAYMDSILGNPAAEVSPPRGPLADFRDDLDEMLGGEILSEFNGSCATTSSCDARTPARRFTAPVQA